MDLTGIWYVYFIVHNAYAPYGLKVEVLLVFERHYYYTYHYLRGPEGNRFTTPRYPDPYPMLNAHNRN